MRNKLATHTAVICLPLMVLLMPEFTPPHRIRTTPRAARHAALVRAKVGRAAAVARLRARQHGDVQRVLAEVGRRGRDCERLYDLVRFLS
jgi:hypothetical protein